MLIQENARELKKKRAHTHALTHTHTHARTHARTHTHAYTEFSLQTIDYWQSNTSRKWSVRKLIRFAKSGSSLCSQARLHQLCDNRWVAWVGLVFTPLWGQTVQRLFFCWYERLWIILFEDNSWVTQPLLSAVNNLWWQASHGFLAWMFCYCCSFFLSFFLV